METTPPTQEEISAAMGVLSRMMTPEKREARRRNIAEARKHVPPRPCGECNCTRQAETDPLKHKSDCRLYRREMQRQWRAKKKAETA